jgi:CheY-like chemotaxis protein
MKRILLVDDDHDDQLLFREALESIGSVCICDVAENGKLALEQLKSSQLPDIIFLDLNMPILNGFDFLEEARKDQVIAAIPTGILTTSNSQQDIELSKQLGARFFITKPNDFQTLCDMIAQTLSVDFSKVDYLSYR